MEDFRLPKKILNAKLDKKWKIGRPKLRWFDDVQTDIRTLEIKRWMCKAQGRLEWARTQGRLRSNLKDRNAIEEEEEL
jgi:hypothetical protein